MANPVSINKSLLFKRAWEIFRETYSYPSIPFSRIGRHCFGSALKRAWAEARETAALKAMPAAEKAQWIKSLNNQIADLAYRPLGRHISQKRRDLEIQISKLAA